MSTISYTKQAWLAERSRYTWFLRPPINKVFDHSHWWDGQSEVEPIAALYELARRHPLVGEARLRVCHTSWYQAQSVDRSLSGSVLHQAVSDLKQEPETIRCLFLIGAKPWPYISEKDRRLAAAILADRQHPKAAPPLWSDYGWHFTPAEPNGLLLLEATMRIPDNI